MKIAPIDGSYKPVNNEVIVIDISPIVHFRRSGNNPKKFYSDNAYHGDSSESCDSDSSSDSSE